MAIELNLVNQKFYKKLTKKQNDCTIQLSVLKGTTSCLQTLLSRFDNAIIIGYINNLILQTRALHLLCKNSCNYIVSDFLNFINCEIQFLIQILSSTEEEVFIPHILSHFLEYLLVPFQNIGILARKLKTQSKKYGCSQKSVCCEELEKSCEFDKMRNV